MFFSLMGGLVCQTRCHGYRTACVTPLLENVSGMFGMSQIRDGWVCFVFEGKVAKACCADSPVLVR